MAKRWRKRWEKGLEMFFRFTPGARDVGDCGLTTRMAWVSWTSAVDSSKVNALFVSRLRRFDVRFRYRVPRLVRREVRMGWEEEGRQALVGFGVTQVAGWAVPVLAYAMSGADASWDSFRSHFIMMGATVAFGLLHSGLASLRPMLTPRIGERIYRVGFALLSLPSAVAMITYFIAHRYDGMALWTLQGTPWVHELVVVGTVVSFFLLYPATFNLLEVAAIAKPSFRIYETGVMRITRHPQLWGQILWCLTHTLWMGSTLTLTASLGLISHHFLGAWNGDRRLRGKYGKEWEEYADRTSLLPFQAVLDGRQTLDISEFLRPAYLGVLGFVYIAYHFHPDVLRLVGSFSL